MTFPNFLPKHIRERAMSSNDLYCNYKSDCEGDFDLCYHCILQEIFALIQNIGL